MSEANFIYDAKHLLKLHQFEHILTERRLNYWAKHKGLPFMQPGGHGCLRFYDVRLIEKFIKGLDASEKVYSQNKEADRRLASGGKGLAYVKPKASKKTSAAQTFEGGLVLGDRANAPI